MKHVLGLDIGTNSIGWALMFGDNIIDKGVIIFPIGTNLIKGVLEETKNYQRGTYRRTKRNLFRFKLRRKDLKVFLKELDMLPDFKSIFKIKDSYQASELYKLRSDAINKQIPIEEIGRLFLLINKHRGFKSNSKAFIDEKPNEEDGKVKEGISQLREFMENNEAKTIGDYFHKMYQKSEELYKQGKWHNIDEPFDERAIDKDDIFILQNNRGIRRENGRYVDRSMYEHEFDLIWEEQKKYYNQLSGSRKEYENILKLSIDKKRESLRIFKETYYWKIRFNTIFYQRQLKSQKKFIGKCQFEQNKRTAPISSLIFQEFRILKQLADVRYSNKENEIYNQVLPIEWQKKIIDHLIINPKLNLREGKKNKEGFKNADVMDILGIVNKKSYEFNFDNSEDDKKFEGNRTLFSIFNACGETIFNLLKSNLYKSLELKNKNSNQLDALWHVLYMAKDDDWLKDTLLFTWGFDESVTNNLLEIGLEEGFASYSSKVLKKIIPFMKQGKDEYEALVLADYLKGIDEVKEDIVLSNKIKQLKNNELRNPVVEKAVSQTIKLVNAIIKNKEYNINQEELIIRIESTREFKKPKIEREKIRRGNTDVDKKREEYARFLNDKRKSGELKFPREVYKNDSIIHKFELWLELGGDKNDPEFKNFEKLVERKDRDKHKLWLECDRICPYTGNIINLSNLFSPGTEIEHIIPYSRSLDDSFLNKTITFNHINKEKGNLTSYEYIKKQGDQAFKDFQKRLKSNNNFSKEKIDKIFLKEKVEQNFSNAQISNTSYIAKYVRKKLQEVCRDVQFTNGSATGELRKNDWHLGNLLDKIRYEEESSIDIDNYIREFNGYRKDFEAWRKKENNSADISKINWKNLTKEITFEYEKKTNNPIYEWWQSIQKFEAFRGLKGKKDRSDHRHHLLDAIITACTSRSIIQKLSTLNAQREINGYSMYDEYGNITREKIECPLEYSQIKEALKHNLIYHKTEQRLITSKTNRTKKIKKDKDNSSVTKQKTYSVRGSIHKDTYYGKITLNDPNENGSKEIYTTRYGNYVYEFTTEKSLEVIYDKEIKEILNRRLKKFKDLGIQINKEAYEKHPLYRYSLKEHKDGEPESPLSKKGKLLPVIKKVRALYNFPRKMIQLNAIENKEIINTNRYAESDGNYIMVLYERKEFDKKGNEKKSTRDFTLLKFKDAIDKKRKKEQLFNDEKLQEDGTSIGLMKYCPHLKQGDMVIMYENKLEEINWDDKEDLKKRLYKVTQLSSNIVSKKYEYGYINFAKHNVSTNNASYENIEFSINKPTPFIINSHKQLKAIKVKINVLGEIEKNI